MVKVQHAFDNATTVVTCFQLPVACGTGYGQPGTGDSLAAIHQIFLYVRTINILLCDE
jgi:hypothetical protein